jgi:mycofactocin system creatininase family protein
MSDLAHATWPDIEATDRSCLLVIPIGSVEQHGPHLPFDTDARIANEMAHRLATTRTDVVVAPVLPYGASGEHAAFAGTLLVNHAVLAAFLIELVRSARPAFKGVAIVSGHGGNQEALAQVDQQCSVDGDQLLTWFATTPGGDAHAGRTETSMMLAIAASVVRLNKAEAGNTRPLSELLPLLRAEGVRPVSSNGVLGDPGGASAEEGELLLKSMAIDLVAKVDERWPLA